LTKQITKDVPALMLSTASRGNSLDQGVEEEEEEEK
jgi:hypothetical protein